MKKLYFLFLLLVSYSLMKAQSPMSIKELTDSISRIVEREHIPGLMLGIATNDSVLFSGGFGYADVEGNREVNGQTLFRLGSITKMFVSLAILKLVEEGKLSLNDELKKIAPEVPFQNKWENSDPVRIVHLLEHTAGFDDMKLNRFCSQDGKGYKGLDAVLFEQNSMVCRWRPGERFAYSNPGYVILGYLIEKYSGKPYDQYLDDIILRPLAMTATNFDIVGKYKDKDVAQYVVHGARIIKVPTVTCLIAPAGALWSGSDDMVKFIQFLLRNGEPVFSDSILSEMETSHSSLAAKAGLHTGYGLGNYNVNVFGGQIFHGHDGLMGTCYSSLGYNRQLGIGFIISSNGNNPNMRIKNLVAEFVARNKSATVLPTIQLDRQSVSPLLGYYTFGSPRNEIAGFKDRLMILPKLELESDGLYIKDLFGGKQKLLQSSDGQFIMEGFNQPTVILTRNKEGKNVLLNNGSYFEQSTVFDTWTRIGIILLALFFAIVSFVPGLVAIVATAIGRQKWQDLPMKIIPMISILLLIWAVINLLEAQQETYLLSELNTINSRTLIIFLGTLLLGIFSLAHLAIVMARFRKMKRLAAWYWLLTGLSLCYISFFLFQNGWIGLRTWAM